MVIVVVVAVVIVIVVVVVVIVVLVVVDLYSISCYLSFDRGVTVKICYLLETFRAGDRPAYLYRFSRDIPILALNHDFPISCGGVPILEDAGIFSARRFVLFCRYSRILPASCTYRQSRRCVAAMNQC